MVQLVLLGLCFDDVYDWPVCFSKGHQEVYSAEFVFLIDMMESGCCAWMDGWMPAFGPRDPLRFACPDHVMLDFFFFFFVASDCVIIIMSDDSAW
jgi:hypothetical protein